MKCLHRAQFELWGRRAVLRAMHTNVAVGAHNVMGNYFEMIVLWLIRVSVCVCVHVLLTNAAKVPAMCARAIALRVYHPQLDTKHMAA